MRQFQPKEEKNNNLQFSCFLSKNSLFQADQWKCTFISHFSLFGHLKFAQNFIWQLDRGGVRERERWASDRWWQTKIPGRERERERVRRGRRVEGWRGWETDGDSALAVSLRGDKQPIWDLSRKEKEMEIREREGIWRNAKWGEDDFFS